MNQIQPDFKLDCYNCLNKQLYFMDSGDIEKVKVIIEKKTGKECSWEHAEECADMLNLIAEMIAEIIERETN